MSDCDDGRARSSAWTIATGPGAHDRAAAGDEDALNPYYPARGGGDCGGRLTMDDWIHHDDLDWLLAYDPTWDDCDGAAGP